MGAPGRSLATFQSDAEKDARTKRQGGARQHVGLPLEVRRGRNGESSKA